MRVVEEQSLIRLQRRGSGDERTTNAPLIYGPIGLRQADA
jgi:hypothetical protein